MKQFIKNGIIIASLVAGLGLGNCFASDTINSKLLASQLSQQIGERILAEERDIRSGENVFSELPLIVVNYQVVEINGQDVEDKGIFLYPEDYVSEQDTALYNKDLLRKHTWLTILLSYNSGSFEFAGIGGF